ncbi:hypothetical protein R3I93_019063 [Phoxinus phoxinus]|uniref:Uncharacterized protein n=1 Tax=Phoxinus phoxinus TaxID=58324 RepID=A0AAN9CE12_9TELE
MAGELDVQQDLPEHEDSFSLFAGVPQKSRPAKKLPAEFKVPLPSQRPAQIVTCTTPFVALAPTWTQLGTASSSSVMGVWSPRKSFIFDETHTSSDSVMDISSTSAFDVRMCSEPADASFAPFTSPSTSSTSSSEHPRGWKERNWIVNESKLMELFQKCSTCGAVISEADQTITTIGSGIIVSWKCNNGHTGHWESCPNTRGMPENNLALPMGFRRGLETLLDEGIDITVVTTDRDPSIRNLMREEYPNIIHPFDPWHVAKGIKKKLVSASNRRSCKELARWVRSVCNHMWWSCCSSKGDAMDLHRRWKSILHHISGVHRWEENGMEYKCYHKDLTRDQQMMKKWLSVDSPAYKALVEIVMDARLLKDLEQMMLFKHTGTHNVGHYGPQRETHYTA